MPSRGGIKHEFLKKKAIQRVAELYGDRINSIYNEQKREVGRYGRSECTFKVAVSIGTGYSDDAERLYYPDIIAHISPLKNDGGKDIRLVIECEVASNSTLITGKPSMRNYGYKMIKQKFKEKMMFICVAFDGVDVKSELWDEVWKFKYEKGCEEVS